MDDSDSSNPNDPNETGTPGDPDGDDPTGTQFPGINIVKGSSLDLGTDGEATVGDIITYTYVVTNDGQVTLDDVSVSEVQLNFSGTGLLPSPVYVANSSTMNSAEGTLQVGESARYTAMYAITAADIASGQIDNQAVASGMTPDDMVVMDDSDSSNPNDPNETGTPGDPDGDDPTGTLFPGISIIKGSSLELGTDGEATVGDIITYTYVVTNDGQVTLDDVRVSEVLLNFSGTGPLPSPVYVANSSTMGSAEGILQVDESASYTAMYAITAADIASGQIDNQAVASGMTPDDMEVMDDSDSSNPNDPNETGTPGDPDGDDPTGTPILSCTAPGSQTVDACPNPQDLESDFETWIDGFAVIGGCNSTATYNITIDNEPIFSVDNLDNVSSPNVCGGSILIEIVGANECGQMTSCSSIFRIPASQELEAICPSTTMIADELLTQEEIDTRFAAWISEFGSTGDTCGVYAETTLSDLEAPSFAGGMVDVEFIVADNCSMDMCESQFIVSPIGALPLNMGLEGPEQVCAGNAGFMYNINADIFSGFEITWEYTGENVEIVESAGIEAELQFSSNATEGYIIASIGDEPNTISDSILVSFAEPLTCQTFCTGILHVSSFMISDAVATDQVPFDYFAELRLTSDALILQGSEFSFNAGSNIELQPGFEVQQGAVFEANIESCDGIGLQDEDRFEKARIMTRALEILSEIRKS